MRHIAAAVTIFGLALAGFAVARALAERDARRESERRIAIASAQIQSRIEVAVSLTASLGRFMVDEGASGVRDGQFARNALRWLSPAGLPAAAWAEEVPGAERAAFERRAGVRVTLPGGDRTVPSSSSYLPATLVSGVAPLSSPGIDLEREPGIDSALKSTVQPGGVGVTEVAPRLGGVGGMFLLAPAPNLVGGVLWPGVVAVFLSEATLRAAARNPPGLRFAAVGRASGAHDRGDTVRTEFAIAGRQFGLAMPEEPVGGPGAVLPWIILVAGLLLAVLAGAVGVIAARRARAQQDFDRIFNLSADLVAVANFEGRFTRVNPAAQEILGYSQEALLARPYLDFVHPEDRERTAAEAAAIQRGTAAQSFENRLIRRDGSARILEWTATPVVEDAVMYGMARDVTDRRLAELESERLANEQSALRRVAELVARQMPSDVVFALVTRELGRLLPVSMVRTVRFEPDGTVTVVAAYGAAEDLLPAGTHVALPGGSLIEKILLTERPARLDDYGRVQEPIGTVLQQHGARSGVGGPILVDGRLWGAMCVGTREVEPLPAGTEQRVAQFCELVSTAISNLEARSKVERLAAEQSALRRVATVVAREQSPDQVFAALATELGELLTVDAAAILRYETDASATVVAGWSAGAIDLPLGRRLRLEGENLASEIRRAGEPRRKQDYRAASGEIAETVRRLGIRSAVASPIVVKESAWGVIAVLSVGEDPLPADTEERIAEFSRHAAMAVVNAENRAALARSRARIVQAGDDARRRVERDLHDGAQQRLVSLALELRSAEARVPAEMSDLQVLLSGVVAGLREVVDDLRELSRGLHPAVLSEGGLAPALRAVARRSVVPVDLHLELGEHRLDESIEVAAYYVASEALANTAKHADASRAELWCALRDGRLALTVRDDGSGGAAPSGGSGLTGLIDRVEAIGGTFGIVSPVGVGTVIRVELPRSLAGDQPDHGEVSAL